MAKIYISSTFEDLKDCRHAVYDALRKMRHDAIAMEDYVATDQRPLHKCLSDVAACDVYVGIFAWRYGYIPAKDNPEKQSITEREFREAVKKGKQCLVFLLHPDADWPYKYIEKGDGAKRLEDFRTELANDYTASFFHTAEELAVLVSVSVSNWERDQTPQGISPEAWQQMLIRLGQKDLELQQRDGEIKEWVQKYRDLEQRLTAEGQDSPLAQQAQTCLHAGQLDEAGRLLDQLLEAEEAEVERIASHHFSRARVFDLQFQPLAALPHYTKAYQYRPDNPTYGQAYADILQKQKQYNQAESIYTAVLLILRNMAVTDAATYLPNVATTLNHLGNLYSDTQRFVLAEEVYQEALQIRRQLAATNPAKYLFNVTTTLNNLGVLYSDTQRIPQAKKVYREALRIRCQLAIANPAVYLPSVATTLNNLGALYYDTQRISQAEEMYQEALTTYRQLAALNPAAYLPDVAMILDNLGLLYHDTQRISQAEEMYQEALTTYRQLAAPNPAAYLPNVATTLNNLGALYYDTQRIPQAEEMYQEALTTYRQLAAPNPAAYLPDVAMILDNLGLLYHDTQRLEEALRMQEEAEAIRKQLTHDIA